MAEYKTCRTHHGETREYRCTCVPDTWSEPGFMCGECETAQEDFERDMPYDFWDWENAHLEAEEAAP